MANLPIKKSAIPQDGDRTAGTVEGQQGPQTADPNGNTWVVISGSGPGATPVTTTAATTDRAVLSQSQFFTMQLNLLNDIKKLLWLMAEDQGVTIPDEINQPFNDDVAA